MHAGEPHVRCVRSRLTLPSCVRRMDIWSRLAREGHPLVYEPRMLVFHSHRQDRASLRGQYWSWGEGFMAYLSKTARVDATERR